jgi:CRP/FNR family transcriptional regulator
MPYVPAEVNAMIAQNGTQSAATAKIFANLSAPVVQALDAVSITTNYPTGAVLFVEAETARGMFAIRRGRVKLSVSTRDGKVLILRIAEAGELLGVASVVLGRGYEATAEMLEPCEITFIRQSDLLRVMRQSGELTLWMAQTLSRDYDSTCREIRNLMLSESAGERLARLLVDRLDHQSSGTKPGEMKLTLTHEEIGQMIGTSRETVTRLFAGLKKRHLIQQNGSTVVVPNRMALEAMITG